MNFKFEIAKKTGYAEFSPKTIEITVSGEGVEKISDVNTNVVYLEIESREELSDGFTMRYRKIYIPKSTWETIMSGSVVTTSGTITLDVTKVKTLFDAQKLTVVKQIL